MFQLLGVYSRGFRVTHLPKSWNMGAPSLARPKNSSRALGYGKEITGSLDTYPRTPSQSQKHHRRYRA